MIKGYIESLSSFSRNLIIIAKMTNICFLDRHKTPFILNIQYSHLEVKVVCYDLFLINTVINIIIYNIKRHHKIQ